MMKLNKYQRFKKRAEKEIYRLAHRCATFEAAYENAKTENKVLSECLCVSEGCIAYILQAMGEESVNFDLQKIDEAVQKVKSGELNVVISPEEKVMRLRRENFAKDER